MKKRLLTWLLTLLTVIGVTGAASADIITIKPVTDPWEDPAYLEVDGNLYYAYSDNGQVVIWETPECNENGKYMMVDNGTELVVQYRIRYMNNAPWGSVSVEHEDENGVSTTFDGWVQMSDLLDFQGNPVVLVLPDHPMIENPQTTTVPVSEKPTEDVTPERPQQAITVNQSYNRAIVYTAAALAIVAIALDVYLIVKHKALNKKGE